jgi:hypothetical protein
MPWNDPPVTSLKNWFIVTDPSRWSGRRRVADRSIPVMSCMAVGLFIDHDPVSPEQSIPAIHRPWPSPVSTAIRHSP